MIKVLLSLFLSITSTLAIGGARPYTITSEISGVEGTTFSMTIWNGLGKSVSKGDIPLRDGQIHFQDTSSVPLMIRITFSNENLYKRSGRGYYPVNSQHVFLVAEPGSTIMLKGHLSDFAEVYPKGGQENMILSAFLKAYHPVLNDAINIRWKLSLDSNSMTAGEIAAEKKKRVQLNQRANGILRSFLEQHVSSIAGLYFLNSAYVRKTVSMDEVKSLIGRVDDRYKNTGFYKVLTARIEASRYDVGQPIFEIVSDRTPEGSRFTTADWAGKFYLIDFWGSWCMPCIKDIPFLKAFRQELGERLAVLGIASDTEEKWRLAIEKHALDWQHILIGSGDQDFSTRLNVTGYPTKILVDPNGRIVYRSSGGGEASFKKMAEIVKNWKRE